MRPGVPGEGRARIAMLWVVLVAVGAARAIPLSSSQAKNSSMGWLESLRRQLMQDNYDYLESNSEQASETPSTMDLVFRAYANESDSFLRYSPPQYAPAGETEGAGEAEERGISRKDLLYYVDDVRLAAPAHSARRDNDASPNAIDFNQPEYNLTSVDINERPPQNVTEYIQPASNITSTGINESSAIQFKPALNLSGAEVEQQPPQNVTYKVFKVGPCKWIKLPSARRGGAGPRFVEESGARGVALVSVDGAPFPQFRLPAPRRQYAPADDDSHELD